MPTFFGTKYTFKDVYALRKKCYWIYSISTKSMYVIDLNQFVIKLVANVSVLLAYFSESIIYMLLAEML